MRIIFALILISVLFLAIHCTDENITNVYPENVIALDTVYLLDSTSEIPDIIPYTMTQTFAKDIYTGQPLYFSELQPTSINNMGDTLFGVILMVMWDNGTTNLIGLYGSQLRFNGGNPLNIANWELVSQSNYPTCEFSAPCGQ